MTRWSRRHWWWLVAGWAALGSGVFAWLAWVEWVETGRRYRRSDGIRPLVVRWSGDPPIQVRCLP